MKRKVLLLIMVIVAVIAVTLPTNAAESNIAEGTSGTCTWVIDTDGVLTISPTDGVSGTLADTNERPKWEKYNESVTKVVVEPGVKAAADSSFLFSGYRYEMTNCTEMDLSGLDTSGVTNMSYMFVAGYNSIGKPLLSEINGLENFDTSSVTNMSYMFYGCESLTELDLSSFDTSSVTNMGYMFSGCAVTELDLSSFDTSSVTSMRNMFYGCSSLKTVTVSDKFVATMGGSSPYLPGVLYRFTPEGQTENDGKYHIAIQSGIAGTYTEVEMAEGDVCGNSGTCAWLIEDGVLTITPLDGVSGMLADTYGYPAWVDYSESVTKVVVEPGVKAAADSSFLFSSDDYDYEGMPNCTEMDLSGLDTSGVADMRNMFRGCESLTELDLNGFDTSSVTNMGSMFFECSSLAELDVSGFDTSSVTNMSYMFYGCESLTELDLSSFDTSSVTNMGRMFYECWSLKTIKVSDNFVTTNVEGSLPHLPGVLYRFTPEGETENDGKYHIAIQSGIAGTYTMVEMAEGDVCGNSGTCAWLIEDGVLTITPLDGVSGTLRDTNGHPAWDDYNESVTKVVVEPGVKAAADSGNMFWDFENCTEMDLSELDTSGTTDMSYMFYDCTWLENIIGLENFDTSNVTDMGSMFYGCATLSLLTFSESWDTSKVTDMSYMFAVGKNSNLRPLLSEINGLENFDTSSVTNMGYMFSGCAVTELDLSSFDTSSVTNMGYMFSGCAVTELDLSSFDTSSVTYMGSMFYSCSSLIELDLSSFDTSSVTNMSGMFKDCESLTELDLSSFDTSSVTNMSSMFDGCSSLTELDLSGFDTSSVTNMGYMFSQCSSLTDLDLSSFDTSRVGNMSVMFRLCYSLRSVTVSSSFVTTRVTSGLPELGDDFIFSADGQVYDTIQSGVAGTYTRVGEDMSTYTITYNANGGSGAPAKQTKSHDVDITLSSVKPTREGYAFVGWNTNASGTGTSYEAGTVYSNNGNVTLYAQWTATVSYTITYNANGGSGAPASQTKNHGVNLALSRTTPTLDGYVFVGWNTNASGTGTTYAAGAIYSTNASLELYAMWRSADVLVSTIELDKTKVALSIGDTTTLKATVVPPNAVNGDIIWISSDPSVATVENGVVTAKKAGSTTIIVSTEDGSASARCVVTVKQASSPAYDYNKVVKKGTPILDGELDDIYKDSLALLNLGTAENAYATDWDYSAVADVYALYDEDCLYLFADVTDDDVLSKGEEYCQGSNPISNDCFEFRISLNGTTNTIKVSVDAYGYSCFGLAWHYELYDYSAIEYKTTHTDTSYTIEIAMPCDKGDLDMIKAGALGLTYQLNDLDVFGDCQNHTTSFKGESPKTPIFYKLSDEYAEDGTSEDNPEPTNEHLYVCNSWNPALLRDFFYYPTVIFLFYHIRKFYFSYSFIYRGLVSSCTFSQLHILCKVLFVDCVIFKKFVAIYCIQFQEIAVKLLCIFH